MQTRILLKCYGYPLVFGAQTGAAGVRGEKGRLHNTIDDYSIGSIV
jgi:hypothetical protein